MKTTYTATKIMPLNFELQLSQPFFFDNQNDLIVKPFFTWRDEESFESRRIGFETTFNRELTSKVNFFITNSFSRDTVQVKAPTVEEDLGAFYYKSILLTGIRVNSKNQLFTPTRGFVISAVAEEAGLVFQSTIPLLQILRGCAPLRKLPSPRLNSTASMRM
jgi:outer membrane protein assembly factor BamA